MKEKPGIDDDSREETGIIIKGADRLEDMVRDMLDFARPLGAKVGGRRHGQAVRDAVAMLSVRQMKSG